MITIAEAIANPLAVVARSGENASEATSAACTNPSALWLISRIENNRRKSAWRSASRVVPMRSPVALIAPIVGAGVRESASAADRERVRHRLLLVPAALLVFTLGVSGGLPAGAQPGTLPGTPPPDGVHVEVSDFLFDPATVPLGRGQTVVFDFVGPSHHTATDSSGMG